MPTSYSRREGDYLYDIDIREAAPPASADRFVARVVNMVRLESGHTVLVNVELQEEKGATLDEAFSQIEAVVEAWVEDRTQRS
jgi:uncharacterized membrane protein YqjE